MVPIRACLTPPTSIWMNQSRRWRETLMLSRTTKELDLAQPLVDASIQFKIHIVKELDMKERFFWRWRCWFESGDYREQMVWASRSNSKEERLGSVSDYCVYHCSCPVVVVRFPDEMAATLTIVKEKEVEFHDGG